METRASNTTAQNLAAQIARHEQAIMDTTDEINDARQRAANLGTIKQQLSEDLKNLRTRLDQVNAAEIAEEIRNEEPTPEPDPEPARFETGATYTYRLACDADRRRAIRVVHRTAKTVTIEEHGRQRRRKIMHNRDGVEYVRPDGSYSMAPLVTADNPITD